MGNPHIYEHVKYYEVWHWQNFVSVWRKLDVNSSYTNSISKSSLSNSYNEPTILRHPLSTGSILKSHILLT